MYRATMKIKGLFSFSIIFLIGANFLFRSVSNQTDLFNLKQSAGKFLQHMILKIETLNTKGTNHP